MIQIVNIFLRRLGNVKPNGKAKQKNSDDYCQHVMYSFPDFPLQKQTYIYMQT